MGKPVIPDQHDPVEIQLYKLRRRDYTLPPEEIRSRAIGNFLRAYLANLFDSVWLPDYLLIKFVKAYDPGYRITKQNVSNLKVRRPVHFRYLPISKESLNFISFVKAYFRYFDGDELYALSGTYVTYRRILFHRSPR